MGMEYLRELAVTRSDRMRNECVRKELETEPTVNKIEPRQLGFTTQLG